MFMCMLFEEKGSPWGELSPVGRLRGVVLMHFILLNPSPSSLRDATRPRAPSLALRAIHLVSLRRGLIVLLSNILKAAFS